MNWIAASGVLSLVVGLILFFSRSIFEKLSAFFNQPVFIIENKLTNVSFCAGLFFLIAGGWLVATALAYPTFWYLHLAGIIIIIFGLLYIFLPAGLGGLSRLADQFLFSPDEMVLEARKIIGLILIAAGAYNILSVFLAH